MPRPAKARLPAHQRREGAQAIYFPACISRLMGALPGRARRPEPARGAGGPGPSGPGCRLHIPDDPQGVCCGVPFSSKGYAEAHAHTVNHAIERFWPGAAKARCRW